MDPARAGRLPLIPLSIWRHRHPDDSRRCGAWRCRSRRWRHWPTCSRWPCSSTTSSTLATRWRPSAPLFGRVDLGDQRHRLRALVLGDGSRRPAFARGPRGAPARLAVSPDDHALPLCRRLASALLRLPLHLASRTGRASRRPTRCPSPASMKGCLRVRSADLVRHDRHRRGRRRSTSCTESVQETLEPRARAALRRPLGLVAVGAQVRSAERRR